MIDLRAVLDALAAKLSDPGNHYFLSAVYYLRPDSTRIYIAFLYLHEGVALNRKPTP
jgi:hypothetical protein